MELYSAGLAGHGPHALVSADRTGQIGQHPPLIERHGRELDTDRPLPEADPLRPDDLAGQRRRAVERLHPKTDGLIAHLHLELRGDTGAGGGDVIDRPDRAPGLLNN